MSVSRTPEEDPAARALADLQRRVEKLTKINAALMQRVERSMDHQANAFSMFQTAIGLEAQVRMRTEELKNALNRLERANDELTAARDAAERANRFKTSFFTAVGHDLLQPLHAARLSLSAMSLSERDVHHQQLTGQIDHALSSIEELLRTILDLSKLESGVVKPAIETFELDRLFRSLAVDLEPIASNKSLILTVRSTEVRVASDPLMLRRILQNLLVNALGYTATGRVLLAARRRDEFTRIEVWDTGPGIALAERERIFEEFQRGAASERRQFGGFGVGLSVTRRMADALGHKIELCSREGKGTRFSVLVPYAGEASGLRAPSDTSQIASQSYGLAGARAIVIDNDAAIIDAMRTLLHGWGCETRIARDLSGVESIMAYDPSFRPDIILADFHLDRGELGLAAVARLRERWEQEIAAIVITADHSAETSDRVASASCEILRKPVKPAELRALMTHLLG